MNIKVGDIFLRRDKDGVSPEKFKYWRVLNIKEDFVDAVFCSRDGFMLTHTTPFIFPIEFLRNSISTNNIVFISNAITGYFPPPEKFVINIKAKFLL